MKILTVLLVMLSFKAYAAESKAIDKEAVRQIIKKNIGLFKKCYSDEINNNPGSGKVVLTWDISDTGEVKTANIKSSGLKNAKIEECIVSTVKTLKFPEAPKGTVANISYPFVLQK